MQRVHPTTLSPGFFSRRPVSFRPFLAGLFACLCVTSGPSQSATATYTYDALGRLREVRYPDGKMVAYQLDAAGNRTQVASGTLPGPPSSIAVPSNSTSGSYTISWGTATGTVTAYGLFEATNSSFSGQTLVYSGPSRDATVTGRGNGTYYYRVRACWDSQCSAYLTAPNGTTVAIPSQIEILNPSIQVGATGYLTQISTLANLNGNAATIQSFTETCTKGSVAIQTGAQSVRWTNSNFYYYQCGVGTNQQCTASYIIRNSTNGQTHSGTSAITLLAQGRSLPSGTKCP